MLAEIEDEKGHFQNKDTLLTEFYSYDNGDDFTKKLFKLIPILVLSSKPGSEEQIAAMAYMSKIDESSARLPKPCHV